MAPGLTARLITARCSFIAATLTSGITIAAPTPRSGIGPGEYIGPGETVILLAARTRSPPRPDACYRALLADPGFILKPDLERPVDGALRRERGAERAG